MPFVQRVVSPSFLSRSRSRARTGHSVPGPKASLSAGRAANKTLACASAAGSGTTGSGESALNGANDTGGPRANGSDDPRTTSSGAVVEIVVNGTLNGNGAHSVLVNGGSRASSPCTGAGSTAAGAPLAKATSPVVTGHEFESVTNITLSNALRQLASLVLIANDIFTELNEELQAIGDRSRGIKERITGLEQNVQQFDPKLVPVPESDLETFVHIKNHFKSKRPIDKELFTPATRSSNLRQLYEAAAKIPISGLRDYTEANGTGLDLDNNDIILTPVLGQKYRKMRSRIDVEIETRLPAAVEELRKWTSSEALGDITVTPDCMSRIAHSTSIMNNTTFSNSSSAIGGRHGNISLVSPSRIVQNQPHQQQHEEQHSPSTATTGGHSVDVTDDNSTVIGAAQLSSSSTSNNNRTANEDDDLPLDHRLPSPEEQCQIIAMKFPAEVVTVDVTGRRFQRMCNARKSMTNYMAIGDQNNLDEDVQTVRRRSRSRKPRGKRRNTIAGTDQREIEEAANGKQELSPSQQNSNEITSSKVGRSKSSDLLKKDTPPTLSILQRASSNGESGKTTLTRFNSLKQWGRNRLRWMQRSDEKDSDKDKERDKDNNKDRDNVLDIDETCNVGDTIVNAKAKKKLMEKERKLSHERKPSYSSSEKSLSLMSHPIKGAATNAASINPVKMRETSSLRRQRRNSGLDPKDEPHSSSGNWSASSESGRTSIGSEITVQPKSSASSTSLNHSNLHSGSGPPSSIISRRRFLNTSASSSVTSEGTATPDLQMHDLFYDDETSSAYSCDTEGYYTSFHVDSGLKTLKEEEPMTPLHSTSALSSTTSFSSTINQTVLTAESEYELFGRGSTSTTTSSAGTVCTTLMATDTDRSSLHGPAVPERKSSLTKLNRSNSNASGGTLERSYSSSTVGSTLERTGTIKRNGVLLQKEVAAVIHQQKADVQPKPTRIDSPDSGNNTSSSPIETNSNESPTQGLRSNSEFEYSECSDLEGVDRIERIRVKTAINSSRIPSMCIITPTTSDDEAVKDITVRIRDKLEIPQQVVSTPSPPPPHETDLDTIDFQIGGSTQSNNLLKVQVTEDEAGYVTVPSTPDDALKSCETRKDANSNNFRKATLQPLNTMFGKLKGVLPNLKKSSPNKEATPTVDHSDESLYNNAGEYVTIADVRNNNSAMHKRTATGNGIYYSNDIVKRNLATVLSGNLNQETEYVSLNELPCSIRCDSRPNIVGSIRITNEINTNNQQPGRECAPACGSASESSATGSGARLLTTSNIFAKDSKGEPKEDEQERSFLQQQQEHHPETLHHQHQQIRGARVTFDAQGKVVYNSDSLKRRKGAHTTFVPGPCVKDPTISALPSVETATSSSPASSTFAPSFVSVSKSGSSVAKVPSPPTKSPYLGGSLTRKQNIVVRPVVSQKTNILASAASQNVDMATDVLSGRYIRDKPQPLADNRGISLALEQPASSIPASSTYHCAPYEVADYQHLSHNNDRYQQQYGQRAHQQQIIEPSSRGQILPSNPKYSADGRFYSIAGQSPFQRNNHIYWTLQHKRPPAVVRSGMPKDDTNVMPKAAVNINDLYATPNKIRNREESKTTPMGFSSFFSPIKAADGDSISPIDPRNGGGFKTSTPSKSDSPSKGLLADELRHRLLIKDGTRSYNASPSNSGRSTPLRGFIENQQPRLRHSWAPETPELPKTCSDRLGTPKTSLMDFKKLLLSKSSKITTTTKLSAVEQLKLNKKDPSPTGPPPAAPVVLNSSMNILELSGSPKTFANRRMLRQGNFGSPSKSLGVKQRPGWKINPSRTDVMSTPIPEAQEDTSSSNSSNGSTGTVGRRSPNISIIPREGSPIRPSSTSPLPLNSTEKTVIDDKIDLKTNIFLQAEENNFMKGEMRNISSATKSQLAQARAQFLMGAERGVGGAGGANAFDEKIQRKDNYSIANRLGTNSPINAREDGGHSTEDPNSVAMPSLETAL